MHNDWRAAYLKQARSDFEVAELLMTEAAAGRTARCHMLHYLQMTLEKLAKGYRIPRGGPDLPHTHKGASHLVQLLIPANPVNRRLHTALRKSDKQRRSYLQSLLPTIHAIERLAPALAKNAQNAEYPWPLPNNVDVMAPFDHGFNEPELMQPKILKVNELLRTIFQFLQQTGEW